MVQNSNITQPGVGIIHQGPTQQHYRVGIIHQGPIQQLYRVGIIHQGPTQQHYPARRRNYSSRSNTAALPSHDLELFIKVQRSNITQSGVGIIHQDLTQQHSQPGVGIIHQDLTQQHSQPGIGIIHHGSTQQHCPKRSWNYS
jgi:hypothetical protein